MRDKVFFDTNIIVYLLSDDVRKANISEQLIGAGGTVSVQVLNEFVNVAQRKLRLSWSEIEMVLAAIRANCTVVPMAVETHELGLRLMQRYAFAFYDSLIVAAALLAKMPTLYSEDMHAGLVVEQSLTIMNPYAE